MGRFYYMEIVDMVITKNWFSGPKSRSVNNFSSSRIWVFDGMSPSGSAVPVIYTLETLSWDPLYLDKVGLKSFQLRCSQGIMLTLTQTFA